MLPVGLVGVRLVGAVAPAVVVFGEQQQLFVPSCGIPQKVVKNRFVRGGAVAG